MSIPPHASMVFKGKIFDVYQWEQDLFDGTKTTFEGIKTRDGVKVLAVHNGKILVCKEEQPSRGLFYNFIGGYIEEGEEPLDAARRELLEESGMQSSEWELVKTHQPIGSYGWRIHFFLAKNCSKVSDPHLDGGERIEIQHLDFHTFLDLVGTDHFRNRDMIIDIITMKYEPEKANEFKQRLFEKPVLK